MIKFIQHASSKYPPRTYENASADATIAFAFDFKTPGEKLTKEAVSTQGKLYIPVHPKMISEELIKQQNELLFSSNASTINIAGNGMYTIIKYGFTQAQIDKLVYEYLEGVLTPKTTLIRSGGQSGFDEAGLKAAALLGIPALCVCPQGWKFMNEKGETICNEELFKSRFDSILIL